jgi:integrase
VRLDRALDLYMGDLARQGRSPRTRQTYWSKLVLLADKFENVEDVTPEACAAFVDRWKDSAVGTLAHSVTTTKVFFRWCEEQEYITRSPAEKLKRPRKPSPDELDVVTLTADQVRAMLAAVETWHEALCLTVLAYMGPRKGAASTVRWRDVDLVKETIKFREKGRKVITKPLPSLLAGLLRAAVDDPGVPTAREDYVIPMVRKQLRSGERDDRIIYRTVKRLAARAGIAEAHVHAIRAAFAVQFLETHVGDLEALQALMGHKKIETTQVYLRRLNRAHAMERVRDLSWDAPQFEASGVKAPSRFELEYAALQAAA